MDHVHSSNDLWRGWKVPLEPIWSYQGMLAKLMLKFLNMFTYLFFQSWWKIVVTLQYFIRKMFFSSYKFYITTEKRAFTSWDVPCLNMHVLFCRILKSEIIVSFAKVIIYYYWFSTNQQQLYFYTLDLATFRVSTHSSWQNGSESQP